VKGETNNLLTPSGYFMFEDNARFGVTVTRPDFNERQIGTEHLQELVKDDTTIKPRRRWVATPLPHPR
jgi:hypothetical protein